MRPLLSSLCLVLLSFTASAQIVGIEEIDSTAYPLMSAFVYAYDGVSLVDPSVAELRIIENAEPRAVEAIQCAPARPAEALSVVLSFDASNGMNGKSGNFGSVAIARDAAVELVGMLGSSGSDIAIQSCNETARLGVDFTTDRTAILGAIAATPTTGSYDGLAMLFDPSAGVLAIARRGTKRRVIVHFSIGDDPALSESDLQRAIAACRSDGIEFHAVLLVHSSVERHGIRETFARLAAATGGTFHDEIMQPDLGHRAALRLRDRIVGAPLCRVTWRSEVSCPERRYATLVEWRGATQLSWYAPPRSASGRPAIQPASILFDGRRAGTPFDTTISISAPYRDLEVLDITATSPELTISPRSFRLAVGESRMVTVTYSPTVERSLWAELFVVTDRCSERVPVTALVPLLRPTDSMVTLLAPASGEILTVGTDANIVWSGTGPEERVDLWFSSDGGSTWRLIAASVSGSRYAWRVPRSVGNRCHVRIERAAGGAGWVRAFGSAGFDRVAGIEVDALGRVFVVGSFERDIDIGGLRLTGDGNDGFLACFAPEGQVEWAHAFSGPGYSAANDVTVDRDGRVYVCGRLSGETQFGSLRAAALGADEAFVARFDRDGAAQWVMQSGTSEATMHATAVAVDSAGRIAVAGEYWDGPARFGATYLPGHGGHDLFFARLDTSGAILWVRDLGARGIDNLGGVTIDDLGRLHATGTYIGPALVLDTELSLLGSKSMFVLRLDQRGDLDWAVPIGTYVRSGDMTEGRSIDVDARGGVRALGAFMGRSQIGALRYVARMWDAFAISIDESGSARDVTLFGTDQHDYGTTIRRHPGGGSSITLSSTATMRLGDSLVTTGGIVHGMLAGLDRNGVPRWGMSLGSVSKATLEDHDHGEDGATAVGMTFRESFTVGDTTFASVDQSLDCLVRVIRSPRPAQFDTTGAFTIEEPAGPRLQAVAATLATGPCRRTVDGSIAITNTGGQPLEITSASISGVDQVSFSLVAPFIPLTLAPGATSSIAIRFTAARIGPHSATLRLESNDERSSTVDIPIIGRGEMTTFVVTEATIDLGERFAGAAVDTVIGVATSDGLANVLFASSTPPITIAPRTPIPATDSASVPVRIVVPDADGPFEFTVVLVDSLCGVESVVRVVGSVVRATIAIQAGIIEARVGEEVELPITLVDETRLAASGASAVRATLRFNATLLDPIGSIPRGQVIDGERHIDLELPIASREPGSTLARLRFRAMLGNDSATALILDDPTAIGGPAVVRSDAGRFRLLDLCTVGGTRLLAHGGAGILRVVSNSLDRSMSIDITTDERGGTHLELVDMLGRTVATLLDGAVLPGRHSITVDVSRLAAGSYYAVLTTPTVRSVVRVDLVR